MARVETVLFRQYRQIIIEVKIVIVWQYQVTKPTISHIITQPNVCLVKSKPNVYIRIKESIVFRTNREPNVSQADR